MTHGLKPVKRTICKKTFFNIFLVITGFRKHCRVFGNSMMPTIRDRDIIIYNPSTKGKTSIKEGDLVVLNHPIRKDIFIIKRVFYKQSNLIEIRGDNKEISNDSRHYGMINEKQILGKVEQIISPFK